MMAPENNVRLSKNESDDALRNIKTLRKQDFKEVKNVLELAEKDAREVKAEVSFFVNNIYTRLCIHIFITRKKTNIIT